MSKIAYNVNLPGALLMRIEVPVAAFESDSARELAEAYLPGAEFVGVSSRSGVLHVCTNEPNIIVRFEESDTCSFSRKDGVYVLRDKWKGEASLLDLLFLCYGAARRSWLKGGLYPVHAAALDLGDGGLTLLVGHSGSGKTSVTLSAVSRGHKVFSGNKTLVRIDGDKLIAVAGTRTMTTKAEDVERHLSTGAIQSAYQGRSAFYLNKEHYAPTSPAMVHRIVLPRLNDGAEKARRLGSLAALHKLYPFFLDAVNADIVMSGGKSVLSGSPSTSVREKLTAGLGLVLATDDLFGGVKATVNVTELEGSMAFINHTLDGKRC